ncbi:hypothetical protein IGI39_003373 [Enterococcus sp. AZ135]|uniref:hypothetical protein n=1 Tax=unclassified Enterococcus TaxID=2608891 RepID=UPI003F25F34F
MNLILQYEQGYISFAELEESLWDFGPNAIYEIDEKCFVFYLNKSNSKHHYNYYIRNYKNEFRSDDKWIFN